MIAKHSEDTDRRAQVPQGVSAPGDPFFRVRDAAVAVIAAEQYQIGGGGENKFQSWQEAFDTETRLRV